MGLARSTYYAEPRGQSIEEARLVAWIAGICAEWPRYGYRRVTAQLRHEGLIVNHKKVMRLMQENGLSVRPRRRFVVTTRIAPTVARCLPTAPGQSSSAVPTNCGSPTSPTSRSQLALSTWPPSSMPGRAAWSAMPSAGVSMRG